VDLVRELGGLAPADGRGGPTPRPYCRPEAGRARGACVRTGRRAGVAADGRAALPLLTRAEGSERRGDRAEARHARELGAASAPAEFTPRSSLPTYLPDADRPRSLPALR